MIAVCGGLTVRIRTSTVGSTLFFFFNHCITLMGFPSLTDNSKYGAFIYFLKPVLKVTYVVNSCLVPPLNPAVKPIQQPAVLTSYEHLGEQS